MNISGSYSATSTTSPRPVRVRLNSAVVVPNAADRPAMGSAKPNGGGAGGGSGQPLCRGAAARDPVPAGRLPHRADPGAFPVRAGLAEPGPPGEHQPGVLRREHVVA